MKALFLDSSYLLALEIANDQNHPSAVEHWNRMDAAGLPELVTTTYVFSEVVTYLNSRALHDKAVDVGTDLLESLKVRMIHVDEELFDRAWSSFVHHRDKRYSLTDCASFVLMRELGISAALAFDRHFRQAGFDTEP
jgi:uncharacterized protein